MSDAHTAHDDHGHPEHLAHHFETSEQQMESGKLGMWVFLATEILMFGGLFCAYAVYRANNPDVFLFAHKALDTKWGAINTIVLLASSFTMAWGVRCAQLGQKKLLISMLALTLLGGFGFMAIKTVEYKSKWDHDLWVGGIN
ncbi:MAG: cytochrome c oxidase subunit 3, partial [Planctomycetota bacterium]